jgi:hypothetical protein
VRSKKYLSLATPGQRELIRAKRSTQTDVLALVNMAFGPKKSCDGMADKLGAASSGLAEEGKKRDGDSGGKKDALSANARAFHPSSSSSSASSSSSPSSLRPMSQQGVKQGCRGSQVHHGPAPLGKVPLVVQVSSSLLPVGAGFKVVPAPPPSHTLPASSMHPLSHALGNDPLPPLVYDAVSTSDAGAALMVISVADFQEIISARLERARHVR